MPYYAIASGKKTGIFTKWNECSEYVNGYKNAVYKKFDRKKDAIDFMTSFQNGLIDDVVDSIVYDNFEVIDETKNELNCFVPFPSSHEKKVFVPDYYVYTDGACSNNGKKNSIAGIGVFFGMNDARNISKKVEGKQTNNTAELTAIIEAYKIIENDIASGKKIMIVSDSEYAIKCATSYGEKCFRKGWKDDIPNKQLVQTLYEMYSDKPNVRFMHIMAHTINTDIYSIGNSNADKLANLALGLNECPYNNGNNSNNSNNKINKLSKLYLQVPFEKKDLVKPLGAMWDFYKKKWYIYDNNINKEEIIKILQ